MLYNLAIVIYDILVHFAAPFSRKPRKMMKGHWVVYELLRQQVEKGEQYIWFHAASLGEFEQGRPLIEMIREKYPDYKILLTFFSPSGYEVRKHYRGADSHYVSRTFPKLFLILTNILTVLTLEPLHGVEFTQKSNTLI